VKLTGFGVFPGRASGEALVVRRSERAIPHRSIDPGSVDAERARLDAAVDAARAEILGLKDRLTAEAGADHAYLFDAQIHMLADPLLVGRARTLVAEKRIGAEWALAQVGDELRRLFARASPTIAERSHDLDDVLDRLLAHFGPEGGEAREFVTLTAPVVLVVEDLKPSEAAALDWTRVRALVADHGSPTHHMAIVARSRGIPCVLGLGAATAHVVSGSRIAVDGGSGIVDTAPGETEPRAPESGAPPVPIEDARPVRTRDGVEIVLRANIEFPGDIDTARASGAMGVGLFRSEYLLLRNTDAPTEDEQVDVYRRAALALAPHPLTVRTFDLSPEDLSPAGPSSPNPALGLRAFRLLSRGGAFFRPQIRALLRVADEVAIRILFPFVGGEADAREIVEFVSEVEAELHLEGRPFRRPPLGAMIEIPSAALTARELGGLFDYLCVGTNDLIQYTLAIDRGDPRVAHLYAPFHRGLVRLLGAVAAAARDAACPLSVCGEMAGDPDHALLLVALGYRELSMSPFALPAVRAALAAESVEALESGLAELHASAGDADPQRVFRARTGRAGGIGKVRGA
jgi:phosphotransferase system enzyme I (PtsI)